MGSGLSVLRVQGICRWTVAVGGALVLAAGAAGAAIDGPRPPEPQVLLLLPTDASPAWSGALAAALRTGLARSGQSAMVLTEDIDTARLRDPDYAPRLQGWLAEKHAGRRVDLIVAPGAGVLSFFAQHAPPAWRSVPVLAAYDSRLGQAPALAGGVAGFVTNADVRGTLAEALALVPGSRRVAVVSGASVQERAQAAALLESVRDLAGVEVVDLGRLRHAELLARVRDLAPDTIVLFLGFRSDADGRPFAAERVLAELARASPRPVFGVDEPLVGHGLVGGRVTGAEALGTALADLGVRVLSGERIDRMPFTEPPFARGVYDARELARHGLDARRLPASAVLRHREETPLERYRWGIIAIAAALLLQAGLIGALLMERERRRRAETQARRSLGQLAHLDRVAAMGELATSLAHELNQPLAAILANAQAARRLLGAKSPDLEEVRASLDDIVDDDRRAAEVIRRMRALLRKDEFRPEPVALNEAVRNVLRLLAQEAARRGVTVECELAADLPHVRGDAVQLQQVVLNLVVNAFEAVSRCPVERRRVGVRTRELLSGQVELLVHDAGEGIAAPHLAQLFEPFFTTKAEGLGMGLCIARSILELHGGEIAAENLDGGGACLRCVLPSYGRRATLAAAEAKAA